MKYILILLSFNYILLSDVTLNAHYFIKTDSVKLSDIVANVKNNITLYTLERNKHTKRVKSKDLISLLKKYGYNAYSTRHAYIKFSKQSPIDLSKIKYKIKKFYEEKYKDIQINHINVNPRGYIDKLPKHYTVKIKSRNYLRKKGTLFIKSNTNRELFFDFRIDAMINVYKSRYKIKRNSELSHINTVKKHIILDKFRAMPLQNIKKATLQSKYNIKEDTILTIRDVVKLFLVKRGTYINVSLDSSNLSISFIAKAMQNASYGDMITVIKSNGARLKVKVIGKNRAEVR